MSRSNPLLVGVTLPECFWCGLPQAEYHTNCEAQHKSNTVLGHGLEASLDAADIWCGGEKKKESEYLSDFNIRERIQESEGESTSRFRENLNLRHIDNIFENGTPTSDSIYRP